MTILNQTNEISEQKILTGTVHFKVIKGSINQGT